MRDILRTKSTKGKLDWQVPNAGILYEYKGECPEYVYAEYVIHHPEYSDDGKTVSVLVEQTGNATAYVPKSFIAIDDNCTAAAANKAIAVARILFESDVLRTLASECMDELRFYLRYGPVAFNLLKCEVVYRITIFGRYKLLYARFMNGVCTFYRYTVCDRVVKDLKDYTLQIGDNIYVSDGIMPAI